MSDLQLALLFPYIPFLGLIIAFALVELITSSIDAKKDLVESLKRKHGGSNQ